MRIYVAITAFSLLLGLLPLHAQESPGAEDQLYFVQFHHPGKEHEPDRPGERSWNTGKHRRKFMLVNATYRTAPGEESVTGPVAFWGEWEPPSIVIKTFKEPLKNGPRTLFKPIREPFRESVPPLMNTDPFVFGGPFLYGNCKQNSKKGPTEMQQMSRGSVILFGSHRDKKAFVLDTVLVVEDYKEYSTSDWQESLPGWVTPEYLDISPHAIAYELRVLEPGKENRYRLYRGATADKPVGRTFSYFPCQPWTSQSQGFARPVIKLDGVIDDTLSGWQRMNPQDGLGDVEALWQQVTKQVLAQGLQLCVAADLPPMR